MKRLLVAALLSLASFALMAQQKVTVGYYESAKNFLPLLTAIYSEIGLTAEFVELPMERSLRSVDSGEIDADIGRVAGSLKDYPNAMESTESVLDLHLQAVVKKDFKQDKLSPADLKAYKLGFVRGAKMAEGFVKTLGVQADQPNTLPSLLQMVANDRVEVALNVSSTPLAQFPEFDGKLITLKQPLHTTRVVHVMNKKWAAMLPKFDSAIRAMKADGRMMKLLTQSKPK